MAKSGRQYADDVRELRAAGFDFPASRGYLLGDAANWSSGLKSAVTRAANKLEESGDDFEEEFDTESDIAREFFDDGAGDNFEEFDDVEFFDYEETDELFDEVEDTYEEVT